MREHVGRPSSRLQTRPHLHAANMVTSWTSDAGAVTLGRATSGLPRQAQTRHPRAIEFLGGRLTTPSLPNQAVSHNTTRCATSKTAPIRTQEMASDGTNQLTPAVGLSQVPDLWVGMAGQRLRLAWPLGTTRLSTRQGWKVLCMPMC